MRSSSVLAFRTLIMLATIVAVPALALFWESVLPAADGLMAKCKSRFGISILEPHTWQQPETEPMVELDEAPRFEAIPGPSAGPTGPMSPVVPSTPAPPAEARPNEMMQAAYEQPLGGQPPTTPQSPAALTPGGQSPDQFSSLERRLRELGATYYLLETFGDGRQYRFHCRMAVAGGGDFSRPFEATGNDPVATMLTVLRQVEDWRLGRMP